MKKLAFRTISAALRSQVAGLSGEGFKQIFDKIDQHGIKEGVDKYGLDKYIEQCAVLAATTGAVSGSGGMFTMLIGVPVDMVNLVGQQFRVTMAVMYSSRGNYRFGFEEFMQMIATSLKIETGMALTKNLLETVAERLLLMLGSKAARRFVPIVGAVIGGATNYIFIKRVAARAKEIEFEGRVLIAM
ncbi:EcsC family protein [Mucilaginibacter myungsuensis]|nr:EcsC family protein [Mucilaginibacter myungsuensis]MDN3597318.1 EcsC family protein [Mucilaginibacter myungsuensis]